MKYKVFSLIILALLLIIALVYRESRIDERKMVKYYMIDESAEKYRSEIEAVYAKWSEKTGITFIEGFKPYRTVTIYASSMENSIEENVIGVYFILQKTLIVYETSEFSQIFLHEAGHSIGIGHNDDSYDIMFPYIIHNSQEITSTCLDHLKKEMNKDNYLLFY